MANESEMSAHCRLCEERTERDESAVIGEHLVCVTCIGRIARQARPALRRAAARRSRRMTPALGLALAYAEAGS